MPELPEVEISRRGIEPHLVGETILHAVVRNSQLRWPVSYKICTIKNQAVLSVQRRAKYLLLELMTGWIIIHLGMSGRLRILTEELPVAEKHDHIDLVIGNGKVLRYTDPRRFGAWLWYSDLTECSMLSNLGPEPLSEAFSAHYLFEKSRAKRNRIAVKPWLMDNKIVVGIGNIYASETLFGAGILPSRPIMSLSEVELALLVNTIKVILLHSIDLGGTTLRNFLTTDGELGYFFQQLQVYGRTGEPCRVCGTLVEKERHWQRSTFFCRYCQK